LHQTLYDFDRSGSSIDLASARTQIAADAVETVKRDLAFRTAQTFYSILYLQKSISVADEQIQTLNEHLSVARKKVATGSATELDVLTIQVRAGSAENQKIRLESALRQQEASLRRLASLPPDAPVYLHGEFTRNPLRFDQDSLLRTARANRIELQTANHEVEAATLQQRVARRTDAPSIRASVAYGVKNGYLPNLEVLRGNYVAGVGVNVPIFDGNRSRSMEEEATASLQGAEARRQDVGLRIQADVQQAIADAQSALARVRVSEINILQAEKALQVARVRYDAGAVPNLDLLDAENERSQASLLNLEALYDYVNGILLLQRATGEPFSLQ
jgi:outer membrane protein